MKRVVLGVASSFLVFTQISADIFGKSAAERKRDEIAKSIKAIRIGERDSIAKIIEQSEAVNEYAVKYSKEAFGSFEPLVIKRMQKLIPLYNQPRPFPVKKRKELLNLYDELRAELLLDLEFLDAKIKKIFADPFARKERRFAYDLYRELLRKVQEAAKYIEPEIKKPILAK